MMWPFSRIAAPYHTPGKSDISAHSAGTARGEEWVKKRGREPGRDDPDIGRRARDATSIDPEAREPIDPRMPHLPPV